MSMEIERAEAIHERDELSSIAERVRARRVRRQSPGLCERLEGNVFVPAERQAELCDRDPEAQTLRRSRERDYLVANRFRHEKAGAPAGRLVTDLHGHEFAAGSCGRRGSWRLVLERVDTR